MATRLCLAIDRYDRHFPFFDGSLAAPDGLALDVRQVGEAGTLRDGHDRHERMLQHREFDAAEVSFSSYLMAHDRGMGFTAIPVFPRRLFSQTQMFVRADSPIETPQMLAGRRVGLQSFQTTLAVLAKGDAVSRYGLDPASVTWVVRARETVPFDPPPGWPVEPVAADADLGAMLEDGAIDALFFSRVPAGVASGRLRRLFRDPQGECRRHFRDGGFFPIMHVIAVDDAAIARDPGIPRALYGMFTEAKTLADSYRDDPGWSQDPFGRLGWEALQSGFGDPWPLGLAANRAAIERFTAYSHAQGLIAAVPAPEALFHATLRES